jgi:hypothetical protein
VRPSNVFVSILRSFAILIVLIGGSMFLQCATSPNPTPNPTPTPVPSPVDSGVVSGCDAACANVVKLNCQFSDSCLENCIKIKSQKFVDCVTKETSCQNIDFCNKNHG